MRALWTVRRRARGVALGTILAVAQVAAQQPSPTPAAEQPIFRAKVNLVRVDVSVFGGDDRAVSDLVAADFRITEDEIPQTVETVQFVSLDGQVISGSNESLDIRSPEHARMEAAKDDVRLFAIFLDDYHVDKAPAITLPLRAALEHFVDALGPRDLVAVMDPLTPLSHLRFTRARGELRERMRTFEGRRGERFPVRSVLEEAQLQHPRLWEVRAGVSLSALTALTTYLGGLREGRKSVIYVSQGPPVLSPGDPNYSRLEEVIEAANRGNVTINVLDPRPLGSSQLGGPEALRRLSHDTGGRAIVNTNDHKKGLRQAVADASAYYLVGYTPSRELADGKFHRIDVDVKRRGVRVLARRGYWAPRAEELVPKEAPPPPEPALAAALAGFHGPAAGRVVDTWIGMELEVDGRARLTVTWEPAVRRAAGTAAAARVMVEPLTRIGGDALAPPQTIASVTSNDEAPRLAAFTLDPGAASVRLTALDASGEALDRWTEPVDVPARAPDTFALATPRVFRARSQFEARALATSPNPVPVASRMFRATDRVQIQIASVHAGAAPTIAAELTNAQGTRLVDLPVPPLTEGKARITLPLASLAPGLYAVRIRAGEGEREIRQVVAFRVER